MTDPQHFDVTDDVGLARVRIERGPSPVTGETQLRVLVSGHEATGRPVAIMLVIPPEVANQLGRVLVELATG